MSYSPLLQLRTRTGPLWRLSMAVLLLWGFINWAGAAPRVVNGLEVPLFADQAERLVVASNSESLRARPAPKKEGSIAGNSGNEDSDESGQALVPILDLTAWRSASSSFYIPSSVHLPLPARYRRPAPRASPKA